MNSDDPIMQAWRDATNAYLAGMGLPPLKEPEVGKCAECGDETELFDYANDDWCCGWCLAEIVAGQERDKRADDPRRGQADEINRR